MYMYTLSHIILLCVSFKYIDLYEMGSIRNIEKKTFVTCTDGTDDQSL